MLDEVVAAIRPLDAAAQLAARQRQAQLTKPPGSLGVLEDVSIQLCGLAGRCPPPMPSRPPWPSSPRTTAFTPRG